MGAISLTYGPRSLRAQEKLLLMAFYYLVRFIGSREGRSH